MILSMKNVIILTILSLLFASCSNDENIVDEPLTFDPNLLLKGWSYDTVLLDGTLFQYGHNQDCNRDYFGFLNRVGQLYQFEETYYTNDYCTSNSTILRWEPVGSRINFYFGTSKVDEFEVISISENHFTFAIDRDLNNDGTKERLIVNAIPYDPYNSFGDEYKSSRNLKVFPVKLHLYNEKI